MSLWLETCYVTTPSCKEGYTSRCPPKIFIWRQQGKKELLMCIKSAFLLLSQGLLRCVGAAENFLQIKYCLGACLEKLRKVECFGGGEDRSLELYVVSTLSPSRRYFLLCSCLAPMSTCN